MASNFKEKQLQTQINEIIGIQNELEVISNVDDVSLRQAHNLDVKKEREELEKLLDRVYSCAVKLKSRLNMLVPINRLPVELFTYIVRLTSKQTRVKYPSYISYTWVCHHWRSILIQTPDLWTTLQLGTPGCAKGPPITPFDREFLKRSKSVRLDVDLWLVDGFLPMLEEFFIKESERIHTLTFQGYSGGLIPLVLPKIRLPSLKGLVYHPAPPNDDLYYLLPCIIVSDHLETLILEFEFWRALPTRVLDQLTPIFSRLRKLSLRISAKEAIRFVLDTLRNNTKLRALQLIAFPIPVFDQIIWPELQFLSISDESLLQNVQAPKLSTLHLFCHHPGLPTTFNDLLLTTSKDNSILGEFDYSSIKCLHIVGSRYEVAHNIVGLKETVHPESVLSMTSEDFLDKVGLIHDNSFIVENILFDTWRHGCFRFEFKNREEFVRTLEGVLSTIFPRLTGLSELCLMSGYLVGDEGICFDKILIRLPSIEKLIVSGNMLMDLIRLLRDTPLCPRLKYLSYNVRILWNDLVLEENENPNFAEDLGKLLVECVQSRHEVYGNMLEYIVLGNCPPLPDNRLDECKRLGTMVITERDLNDEMDSIREDGSGIPMLKDREGFMQILGDFLTVHLE